MTTVLNLSSLWEAKLPTFYTLKRKSKQQIELRLSIQVFLTILSLTSSVEEYPAKVTTKESETRINTCECLGIPLKSQQRLILLTSLSLSSPSPIQIPHTLYKLKAGHVHPAKKVKLRLALVLSHSLGLPTRTGIWLRQQNSGRLFSESKYTFSRYLCRALTEAVRVNLWTVKGVSFSRVSKKIVLRCALRSPSWSRSFSPYLWSSGLLACLRSMHLHLKIVLFLN